VRCGPKGADDGRGRAHRGRGRSGGSKHSEGGSGSVTGTNQRSREGEGRLWCASKGAREKRERGVAMSDDAF
jgi:hypothetical protein